MKLNKRNKAVEKIAGFNPQTKIKFKFDAAVLNSFIGYIYCHSPLISKMNLTSLKHLLNMVDMQPYQTNANLYIRLKFAKKSLEAILDKGIVKDDLVISYAREDNNDRYDRLIANIPKYTQLNDQEIKFITKTIYDRVEFSFIMIYKDIITNIFYRIDTSDYEYLGDIISEVKDVFTELLSRIRKTEQSQSKSTFSLENGVFENVVEETVIEETNPNAVLLTGLKTLNLMLSPGLMPKRLYLVLGITGSWKSAFLLSTCLWIKKYNRVKPLIQGHRPTVLYISNENTINESVVRLYNMAVTNEDITKVSPQEAVKRMRDAGLVLENDDDIDIVMMYFGNFEISTSDVYSIIEDLEDQNREVICFVLDYIKRIRPSVKAVDERTQLANVSNELKDLSVKKSIPVVTAQQINRAGNMTVDAAMESGKKDLARFLGRGNIAQSWDMLENCDWTAILNIELERSTDKRYLTIKEIKKRYRSMTDITYMNQPFMDNSTIRLVEDVNMDKSVAKLSLQSDLVGINPKAEEKKKEKAKKINNMDDIFDETFNFDNEVTADTISIENPTFTFDRLKLLKVHGSKYETSCVKNNKIKQADAIKIQNIEIL